MKVPLSWLSEHVALGKKFSNSDIESAFIKVGFEVESVEAVGRDVKGPLVIGRVIGIEELAGHKKPIRFVSLDCGEGKSRYVICGATNFGVNDLVVVALPGSILPGNFAISARETYGKTSNGMICSAKELGLGDDHTGIIVLPKSSDLKPGVDAKSLLELEDIIFDISVNPDRGYAMSIRGLARELATALGVPFKDPVLNVKDNYVINKKGIQVSIKDKTTCDVIFIRTIADFNAEAATPIWMRRRIEKCGMRSISLAVDITNYVMLELGQPLHAFDANKIDGQLQIRKAGKDTELKTLDGVIRKLKPSDLVVADAKRPLALAGTMGGESSEVTKSTSQIALEAARFNPINVAQNSRRHILSSEASRRLERGVDPKLSKIASARAINLMITLGGAKYIGSASDGKEKLPTAVKLDTEKVSSLLGLNISLLQIKKSLKAIGCTVSGSGKVLKVQPPSWRFDLNHYSDFSEEVARLIGYEKIPNTLPFGKSAAALTPFQKRRRFIANYLASIGFVETYNSPFTNQQFIESLGFEGDRAKTFKIANPLSEEFPVLRTHLLPGLFQTVARNKGRGQKNIAIFEIGSLFRNVSSLKTQPIIGTDKRPNPKIIEEIYKSVPKQPQMVAGIVSGKIHGDGWQGNGELFEWNDAIEIVRRILDALNQKYSIIESNFAPWHPGRCAEFQVDGRPVAHAGEIHPGVINKLGLDERSCAFGILLSELPASEISRTISVNAMTPVIQDLALVVSNDVSMAKVMTAIKIGGGEFLESVELFDRYDKIGDGKISLAFTLTFRAPARTLTSEEVSRYREGAIQSAAKSCGATVRT